MDWKKHYFLVCILTVVFLHLKHDKRRLFLISFVLQILSFCICRAAVFCLCTPSLCALLAQNGGQIKTLFVIQQAADKHLVLYPGTFSSQCEQQERENNSAKALQKKKRETDHELHRA